MNSIKLKHIISTLLAVIGGLVIGFSGLHYNGKLDKLFKTSYIDLLIILASGALGFLLVKVIMYFARGKLESRGVRLEEIGDERAELIRQKAGFRAYQCFTLLACFISPVFIFFDYKAPIYWMLLASVIVMGAIFLGFALYYSHKLD